MPTATAEALSSAAREFVAGPKRLVIGGELLEAADGWTFPTIDPATGEGICEVAFAGAEDVRRAVAAAQAALDGPLRKVSPAKRSSLMYQLAELIKRNGDELAELESLDNGKPLGAAKGDIAATVNHLRYYAGWPTKIEGETIPVSARDVLCYTLREPVGVCAQIVPWNYPLLMAIWKVAPALAAGCAIVLKPAEQTPLTALRLGELALEAGFPEGTLNVLTGDGSTGAALVDDQRGAGAAVAGEDIERPLREAGLERELAEAKGGQRGLLGRLEDDRAAGGERRGDLPRGHQQRIVPGDDLGADADRLAQRVAEDVAGRDGDRLALDLRRPAGVVAEMVDGRRDVALGGGERLAVVERLEFGELGPVGLDQLGERVDQPGPLGGIDLAERAVEGRLRGLGGAAGVLRPGEGHLADLLAGG